MPSTLLDARPTTRRYAARTAVDTVDLHLDAGSRTGLVDTNGARKSTVPRISARLQKLAARVLSRSQRRLHTSGDQAPAASAGRGEGATSAGPTITALTRLRIPVPGRCRGLGFSAGDSGRPPFWRDARL